jgi:hypothetical protein
VLTYETAVNSEQFLLTARGAAEEMTLTKTHLTTLNLSRVDLRRHRRLGFVGRPHTGTVPGCETGRHRQRS